MDLGNIVAIILVGGLVLMVIGNALKKRGFAVGSVIERLGKMMYLLWAGAVVLLILALIWLAFQLSK